MGNLTLLPQFHATRTSVRVSHVGYIGIMAESNGSEFYILEDFRGQSTAFVTSWLQGNGLIKLKVRPGGGAFERRFGKGVRNLTT